MEKMTKVAKFTAIAKAVEGMDLGFDAQEFLANEINMTAKKNARKSNTPTKGQKANAEKLPEVVAFVATKADGVRAKEVAENFNVSTQKASAWLKMAVADGSLAKGTVKGASVFTVANAD